MRSPSLILIEFNELSPILLQDFMKAGLLPNFKHFYDTSNAFTTDAGEEPPYLEPWIQWPTVHFGIPYKEHRIFHLGDGNSVQHKAVGQLLSEAGIPVGLFGSMNLNTRELNGYVVPDPWSKCGKAFPKELEPYFAFVASQVQESSRNGAAPQRGRAEFIAFLMRNGLSATTAWHMCLQVCAERFQQAANWRRGVVLDRIQYDVFRQLNKRFRVRFATFFSNSTAHFQHYFWRNMSPELFDAPPPETDHPSLRGAVLHGYKSMDRMLGRFLRDYPDSVLVLCTALSQQPWTETTKVTFRPQDFGALLKFAGVPASKVTLQPVMAEQFHAHCLNEEDAREVEAALRGLVLEGDQLMYVKRENRSVFSGCRIHDSQHSSSASIQNRQGATMQFLDAFYMIHGVRSGRHHPDGVLWIRNGQHKLHSEKVPLTDIAPTILKHFGVQQPSSMKGNMLPLQSELVQISK